MGYFILRGPRPGTFDTWLEGLCREAGVTFRFSSTLSEEECEVWAAGPREPAAMAAERVHRVAPAGDVVDVRFSDDLAPAGYAYCFRIEDCLTIGVAFIGPYGRAHEFLDRATDVFSREHGLAPLGEGEKLVSRMSFRRLSPEAQPGPLRVGEAAGLQDMLFGLGLRKMVTSGVIAARCRGDEALYQRILFERYDREMARAVLVRRWVERFGFRRLPALFGFLGLFPGRFLLRRLYR
jgi:flavin-dependent dehydrogenase